MDITEIKKQICKALDAWGKTAQALDIGIDRPVVKLPPEDEYKRYAPGPDVYITIHLQVKKGLHGEGIYGH